MPYPIDSPSNKHDLYIPVCIMNEIENGNQKARSLLSILGFTSTKQLFQEIMSSAEKIENDKNIKSKYFQKLSAIYSYASDSPNPPLARTMYILGVADTSLSVVRKLGLEDVDDDDYDKSILHKCTIAVKRIDGQHGAVVPSAIKHDCMNFANFIGFLYTQQLVAIVGPPDKHGRIAFLKSNSDYVASQSNSNSPEDIQNFASLTYVGKLENIKQYLVGAPGPISASVPVSQNGSSRKRQRPEETSSSNDNDDGLWRPSASNNDDDGLWKPPGADDDNNNFDGGSDLWQPPGFDDNDKNDNNSYNPFTNSTSADEINNTTTATTTNHTTFQDTGNYKDEGENNEFHADSGAAAADRFYSSLTRTLETRADSRLYHMRAFNGWVKGTQIHELNPQTVVVGPVTGKRKQNQNLTNQPLRILDLACGKGGDLGKWSMHSRGIANYVGIDVARGSLVDAAIRARKMKSKFNQQRCVFTCADLGSDVPGRYRSSKSKQMQKLSTWSLANEKNMAATKGDPVFKMVHGGGISLDDKFDVVSIQFAIHYMMQTRRRARRFFQTVAQLLEVGGNLIATTIDARVVIGHLLNMGLNLHQDNNNDKANEPVFVTAGEGACRIRFEPDIVQKILHSSSAVADVKAGNINENLFGLEYTFTLVEGSDHASGVGDAVNLPEWLIPVPVLQALAEEVGLELVYAQNFHEFFKARSDPTEFSALHNTMYNMKVLNMNGSISHPEWEISRLYVAVKFKKVREVTDFYNDIEDDEDDAKYEEENKEAEEEEEDQEQEQKLSEIDPGMKAKLYPMAMMKAKKLVGNDIWGTLSSEEKNQLTDTEIRKMIPKQ